VKVLYIREEAEKLNLTAEATWSSYKQALREKDSPTFFDYDKDEIIISDSMEIQRLIDELNTGSALLTKVARSYGVSPEQMKLIINQLVRQDKLNGLFSSSEEYVSDSVAKTRIINLIEAEEHIDIRDQATKLGFPVEFIDRYMQGFESRIRSAVRPYNRIRFQDLSSEVGLPEKVIFTILKRLITDNKIQGSIDMVNEAFIIDQKFEQQNQGLNVSKVNEVPVTKPSDLWYILPLLLGLIGGIISYVSLTDRDKEMAKSMIYFGLAITIISSLIYYSWISSLMRFY
jgi:hypothetical protein